MAVAAHGVALAPQQDVRDVAGPEALARAGDGGERLLRIERPVGERDAAGAKVAMAARPALLAEVGEQRLPAAAGGLAERDHGVELAPLHAPALVRDALLVDLPAAH